MRTTHTRISSGNWTPPHVRKRTEIHTPRRTQSNPGIETPRKSNLDFLTTIFTPIPIGEIIPLFSRDNYDYLYRSASNYVKQLGLELEADPDTVNFEDLYMAFDKLLPHNHYLYLSHDEGADDLDFYIKDDANDFLTCLIPVHIIDRVKGELRDIYISFFSLLQQHQKMVPLPDNYLLTHFSNEIKRRGCPDKDFETLLKKYLKGSIRKKLDLISAPSQYSVPELKQKIQSFKTRSKRHINILSIMSEGLDLIEAESFFTYADAHIEEDYFYESYCPVEMTSLIFLIWNHKDTIADHIEINLQTEADEQTAQFLSSETLHVTPHLDTTLRQNELLYEYVEWIKKLNDELRKL